MFNGIQQHTQSGALQPQQRSGLIGSLLDASYLASRCPECAAQLMPLSDDVAEAGRQVGAPSGTQIADHAAKVLARRLTGQDCAA